MGVMNQKRNQNKVRERIQIERGKSISFVTASIEIFDTSNVTAIRLFAKGQRTKGTIS